MKYEYRVVRTEPYRTLTCPGFSRLSSREGYYCVATDRADAIAQMEADFPNEGGFIARRTGKVFTDEGRFDPDATKDEPQEGDWTQRGHIFTEYNHAADRYTGHFIVVFGTSERREAAEQLRIHLNARGDDGEGSWTAQRDDFGAWRKTSHYLWDHIGRTVNKAHYAFMDCRGRARILECIDVLAS